MTTLLTKIKAQQLQARKNRATVESALLTTLLGEAAMAGKNDGNRESTVAEVTATIKKFVKNIDSLPVAAQSDISRQEKAILEAFLPKQLTEDELRSILIAEMNLFGIQTVGMRLTMGDLMKFLKDKHAGTYDGGMASKLIKELLA